jgi:hypothetical protein
VQPTLPDIFLSRGSRDISQYGTNAAASLLDFSMPSAVTGAVQLAYRRALILHDRLEQLVKLGGENAMRK